MNIPLPFQSEKKANVNCTLKYFRINLFSISNSLRSHNCTCIIHTGMNLIAQRETFFVKGKWLLKDFNVFKGSISSKLYAKF